MSKCRCNMYKVQVQVSYCTLNCDEVITLNCPTVAVCRSTLLTLSYKCNFTHSVNILSQHLFMYVLYCCTVVYIEHYLYVPPSPIYSTAPTFLQMSSAMVSVFVLASSQLPFPHVVMAAANISQLNTPYLVVKVA